MSHVSRSVLAVLCPALALAGCEARGTSGQVAQETWRVAESDPCLGLTVGWTAPISTLREVVGAGLEPAEGGEPGQGTVILFAAKCPDSEIDGEATGPFTIVHTIVPVEAPPLPGAGTEQADDGQRSWVSSPLTVGPESGPVRALWERHGFETAIGEPSLEVRDLARGYQAELVLEGPDGRIEARAEVDDATTFEMAETVHIVGSPGEGWPLVVGPEQAVRHGSGSSTVSITGDTPLSGLGLSAAPDFQVLDREFSWTFSFRNVPVER